MISNAYNSKYPSILIDERRNSANDSLQKKITIEEYYDLMHHTHNFSDLAIGDDGMTYKEMQTTITELKEIANNFNNIMQEQKNTINQLTETVNDLKSEMIVITDIDGTNLNTKDTNNSK